MLIAFVGGLMRSHFLAVAALACAACVTTGIGHESDGRMPLHAVLVASVQAQPWGAGLEQIQATVIDVGDLQGVPYLSYANAKVEVNVYGDPELPAAVEIGIKPPVAREMKAAAIKLLSEKLAHAADRAALERLGLNEAREESDDLLFEVTPPTAPDAYGAWWVTVSAPRALVLARAAAGEAQELVDASPSPEPGNYAAVRPSNGGRVYVRSYVRKDGTYVRAHTRRR